MFLQARSDSRPCEDPILLAKHGAAGAGHENHGELSRIWTHVQGRGLRLLIHLSFYLLVPRYVVDCPGSVGCSASSTDARAALS